MSRFSFFKGGVLSQIVEAIKDLVESANFTLDDNGLSIQTMDMSHVCLVSLFIPKSSFYSFEPGEGTVFGVHLGSLSKVLKFSHPDSQLDAVLAESGDSLTFSSGGKVTAEMKLIDIESEGFEMPTFDRDATVEILSSEFKALARDLSTIGDTVRISVSDTESSFSTVGDVGKVSLRLCDGEEGAFVKGTSFDGEFALKYLMSFSKASPLSKKTRILLSNEMPMEVNFGIEGGGGLSFFLAPKIEDACDDIEED